MHSIDRYAEIREATARVRERPLLAAPKVPNELELQARWFAGEFGRKFQTLVGELVEIVQFGFWNREAGPDFQDAAIRLASGPILRGPIEIDLLDRYWELHGHATNPAFDDAILHVFLERSGVEFFARTSTHRNVPQIQLDLAALRDAAAGMVPLAHAGRCVAPLRNLEAERVTSVLEAAAKFRLRQKANRLRQRIEVHGRDEALFQAIAEALGYKQNRLPFTLLTQRLPLAFLRKRREDAEALLFGFAGFLDTPNLDRQRKSTRSYLRSLWDRWWKYREQFSRLVLPAKLGKTSGAHRGGATFCRRSAATRLRALLGRTTGIAPNLRRFLPARCLRLRELSVTGAIAEMVKTSFQSSFLVGTEPFLSFRAKAEESLTIDENKVRDVSTSSPGVFCGMLGKDGKQGKKWR